MKQEHDCRVTIDTGDLTVAYGQSVNVPQDVLIGSTFGMALGKIDTGIPLLTIAIAASQIGVEGSQVPSTEEIVKLHEDFVRLAENLEAAWDEYRANLHMKTEVKP